MSKLTDCVGLVSCTHPNMRVSIPTLLYSLYLSDWKSSIEYGRVITSIKWQAKDVFTPAKMLVTEIMQDRRLRIIRDKTSKTLFITYKGEQEFENLSKAEVEILYHTSKVLSSMPSEQQLKLVASTYPLIFSEDEDSLDLPFLASKYKQVSANKYHYIV